MDSEGIWKACTMKVITKTAITTVTSNDCSEPSVSACGCFSITSIPASLGPFVALGAAIRFCGYGGKVFQHLVGCVLLRILFSGAICPPHEFGLAFGIEGL